MSSQFLVRDVLDVDIHPIINLLDKNLSSFTPSEINYRISSELGSQIRKVVEFKGGVVGYASLLVEVNARGGKLGHVEDVVVSSDFQGCGIGLLLMESLEEEARALGCYKLGLASSLVAEKFYEGRGFINTAKYYTKMLMS